MFLVRKINHHKIIALFRGSFPHKYEYNVSESSPYFATVSLIPRSVFLTKYSERILQSSSLVQGTLNRSLKASLQGLAALSATINKIQVYIIVYSLSEWVNILNGL